MGNGVQQKKAKADKSVTIVVNETKMTFTKALSEVKENEVVNALHKYGTENIIKAYRKANVRPHVDLLKSYFEHFPNDITDKESILLQKAYGSDYMEAQYARYAGPGVVMAKMDFFDNIFGKFGRKFGRYKRLKHDNSSLKLKTLEEAENALLQNVKKSKQGTNLKEAESFENLIDAKLQKVDQEIETMQNARKSDTGVLQDTTEKDRGGNLNPNMPSRLSIEGEKGIAVDKLPEDLSMGEKQQKDYVDTWKSYNTFIHLHGYTPKKYDTGMIQIESSEIALAIAGFELFTLKNTNFAITYDPMAKSESVSMTKGEGSIQLGALNISAKNMCYTDIKNPMFTAENITAALQTESFSGDVKVEKVTIDPSGIDFDELSASVNSISALNGGFEVTNPIFGMRKDENGKWTKEISIGSLAVQQEGVFSLKFGQENKESKDNKTNNKNAWKLKETSDTANVKRSAKGWEPQINNATAILSIGEVLTGNLREIVFNKEEMSAKVGDSALNVMFQEKPFTATVNAEKVGYNFTTKSPYLENMNANLTFSWNNNEVIAGLTGMSYSNGDITIASLSGSATLLGTKGKVTGEGISCTKEGKFDFQRIHGSLEGAISPLEAITLQSLTVSIEKPENTEKQTEQKPEKSSGEPYNITVAATEGSLTLPDFEMGINSASCSVTSQGELESAKINGADIKIKKDFITASAATLNYAKDKKVFSANNVGIKLLWGKTIQDVTVENLQYQKDEGISLDGITAKIELGNIAGNNMEANITNASYNKKDGIKVNSLNIQVKLMGKDIVLAGQGIKLNPDTGFSFDSLSANVTNLGSEPGFKLESATLEVQKKEQAYRIIASTPKVGFNAGSTTLNAGLTNFVVEENRLSQATIKDAALNFGGGLFAAQAASVEYTNTGKEMSLEVKGLTVGVKPTEGIDVDFSITRGYYNGKDIALEGIAGSAELSIYGQGFHATVQDGSYQDNLLDIGGASVETTIENHVLTLTGEGITYSKAQGFDFNSLALNTGESLSIGSILTINNGTLKINKQEKEKWFQVTGGVVVDVMDKATMEVKDASFALGEDREYTVGLNGANITVGENMFIMGMSNASYSSKTKSFTAEQLTGEANFGENKKLKVGATNVSYQNSELSLAGVNMNGNLSVASNTFHVDLKDGTYAQRKLEIASLAANMTIGGADLELTGKGFVFNQEGFDFESIGGTVNGLSNIFGDTGISVTDVSVCVSKIKEKSGEKTEDKLGYSTRLSSKSIGIDMNGINLSANGMEFGIAGGKLTNAVVESAKLDINNKMIAGDVTDLQYINEKDVSSFTSTSISVAFNSGKEAEGKATIEGIKYINKKFSFTGMTASFSATTAGISMAARLLKASYGEEGLKAEEADVGVTILKKKATFEGKGLVYSPDKKFDFAEITGNLEGEVELSDLITISKIGVTVKKENDKYTTSVGAGVSMKVEDILALSAEDVQMTLEDKKMKDMDITKAKLNVMNGMIDLKTQTVQMSFVEDKISAHNLEITAGAEKLASVPGFETICYFLKGVIVNVKTLSYSKKDKLTYTGVSVNKTPTPYTIGKFLTLNPDFEQKSVTANLKWGFPGGTWINEKNKENAESDSIKDTPKMMQETPQKYHAESVIKFPFELVLVPGVNLKAAIDIGAGIGIIGGLGVQKTGGAYHIQGDLGVFGDAYVAASMGISLGVANIASVGAEVEAKAGTNLGGQANLQADFPCDGKDKFSLLNPYATYKAEAGVSLTVGGKVTGKCLFFKEKVLYEKQFGKWEVGKFKFEKIMGINPKTGVIDKEDIKGGVKLDENVPSRGATSDKVKTTKKTLQGVSDVPNEKEALEEQKLADIQKERDKLEKILLSKEYTWGGGGVLASASIVEGIQNLSKVYKIELEGLQREINKLEDRLRELIRENASKRAVLRETNSIVMLMEKETTYVKEGRSSPELLQMYYSKFEESYLKVLNDKLDEIETYEGKEFINEKFETNKPKQLKKYYQYTEKRWKILLDAYTAKNKNSEKRDDGLLEKFEYGQRVMDKIRQYNGHVGEAESKSKQPMYKEKLSKADAERTWAESLNKNKQENTLEQQKIDEKEEILENKKTVYEGADAEKAQLETLYTKINSFLENKTGKDEESLVMKDNDKAMFKEICEKINERKIRENIKALEASKNALSNVLNTSKAN